MLLRIIRRNTNKQTLGLIIVCFLWITGCDTTESNIDPDEEPAGDIFRKTNFIPLEIGNTWIYEGSFSGRIDTLSIQRDTTINEQLAFVDNKGIAYYYIETGLIKYDGVTFGSGRVDTYHYQFLEKGEPKPIYEQEGNSSTRLRITTSMVKTDSTITTPAGTFNTTMYRSYYEWRNSNGNWKGYEERVDDIFFAEDVGIIREVYRDFLLSCACWLPARTTDLIEFHIGNNPVEP